MTDCFISKDDDKAFKPLSHQASGSSAAASAEKRSTRGRSRGAVEDEVVLDGDSDGEDEKKKPSRLMNLPNPKDAAIKKRAEVSGYWVRRYDDRDNQMVVLQTLFKSGHWSFSFDR